MSLEGKKIILGKSEWQIGVQFNQVLTCLACQSFVNPVVEVYRDLEC